LDYWFASSTPNPNPGEPTLIIYQTGPLRSGFSNEVGF
jgi:hypothetical protein